MILEPLKRNQVNDNEKWSKIVENIKAFNSKMSAFFKTRSNVKFQDMLIELNIDEEDYTLAIRTTVQSATTFLRRSSAEVSINAYNSHILHMSA